MSRAAFAALRSSRAFFSPLQSQRFSTLPSSDLNATATATATATCGNGRLVRCRRGAVLRARARSRVSEALLREEWLDSLSFPFSDDALPMVTTSGESERESVSGDDSGCVWVVGVDPDVSGAVALLKTGASGCSAQVFDTPRLEVLVGKRVRNRLDARSIIQLLQSFGAPLGTRAYIEQSIPYPKDGKQGWYSGGFTYGLWIGILVASGFSVVPVVSRVWKEHFDIYQRSATKDDSRKVASILFPSLDSFLRRKKDHGRAEALLIAAYGKGLRVQTELPISYDTLTGDLRDEVSGRSHAGPVEHAAA